MRRITSLAALRASAVVAGLAVAGCSGTPAECCTAGETSVRIVNAFPAAVDVLLDGNLAVSALAAGSIGTAASAPGSHVVTLRSTGSGGAATRSVITAPGETPTL